MLHCLKVRHEVQIKNISVSPLFKAFSSATAGSKKTTKMEKTFNSTNNIPRSFLSKMPPKYIARRSINLSKLNLNKEIDRMKTFTDNSWSNRHAESSELAMLGLYFVQKPDKVKCNFCNVVLSDFVVNYDVFKEHLKSSPNCPLLIRRYTENDPLERDKLDRILPSASYDECGSNKKESRVEDEIMYPEYGLFVSRLKSFETWPVAIKQKPKNLADAGFFYLGESDVTVCFSCGIFVSEWESEDDPWVEHMKLAEKECRYLTLNQEQLQNHEKEFEKSKKKKAADNKTWI